jgi:hypothetical protein
LYQGQATEGEIEISKSENALVAIYKDEKIYFYHPALGNAELSEQTSALALYYFLVGISAEEMEAIRTASAARSPGDGKVLRPGESVKLDTGFLVKQDPGGNLEVANQFRRWGAVVSDITNMQYFFAPRSMVVTTNLLDIAGRVYETIKERSGWNLLFSYHSRSDITADKKIETFGAFWRGYVHGKKEWFEHTPEMKEAIYQNAELVKILNDLDFTFFIMDILKNLFGLIPFECADTITNLLYTGIGTMAVQGATGEGIAWQGTPWKIMWDSSKDVIQSGVVCCIKWTTAVPTGGFSWLSLEGVMTIFDIINALSLIREDIIEVPLDMVYSKAYEELKIEGAQVEDPQKKYEKFLKALRESDSLRVYVAGDHKYINKDGSPMGPYDKYGGALDFNIALSGKDIKWDGTSFNAHVTRSWENYDLTVKGKIDIRATGPVLEIDITEEKDNIDELWPEYFLMRLTLRGLPIDKTRVEYFTGAAGDEIPPWNEIKIFIPGADAERKHYISKMENDVFKDVQNDQNRPKDFDYKYQSTEWNSSTAGVYVKFNKN